MLGYKTSKLLAEHYSNTAGVCPPRVSVCVRVCVCVCVRVRVRARDAGIDRGESRRRLRVKVGGASRRGNQDRWQQVSRTEVRRVSPGERRVPREYGYRLT